MRKWHGLFVALHHHPIKNRLKHETPIRSKLKRAFLPGCMPSGRIASSLAFHGKFLRFRGPLRNRATPGRNSEQVENSIEKGIGMRKKNHIMNNTRHESRKDGRTRELNHWTFMYKQRKEVDSHMEASILCLNPDTQGSNSSRADQSSRYLQIREKIPVVYFGESNVLTVCPF